MPQPLMSIAPHLMRPNAQRRDSPLPSNIRNSDEGYTRDVDPNELVSTQVERLGASDNRGLRQSRMRGVQAGAARGGINSPLAAAMGENAWMDAATRMGEQQAGAYQSAAGQNLQSLAGQRIADEGNATSMAQTISNNTTQSGIAQAQLEHDRETDLRRRDWDVTDDERDYGRRTTERQQDRDWMREDEDRNFERGVETGVTGRILETAMNDPTLARNPQAMFGMIDTWMTELRRILNLRPRG